MENPNFGPEFLDKKDPQLAGSVEVNKSVKKARRLGEKFQDKRKDRIGVYIDRLENVFLNEDEYVRERNIEMLRPDIYKAFIIKSEDVPESYFDLQKRIARERGQVVEEIPQDMREQMIQTIISDQKHSIDNWINYFTSNDAVYPPAFKYFVFKNITKLSQFDKKLGIFKTRNKDTTATFPDIYREPLAQICDLYMRALAPQKEVEEDKPLDPEESLKRTQAHTEAVAALSRKFPELYAELTQKSLAASLENRESVVGQWVKYEQGNDEHAKKLFESLDGKGTGWCTAGQSTAETQIKQGDFYVYYTNDAKGNPVQPRLAIRMDGNNKIGEVRGILQDQAVESQLHDVLDEKLSTFGSEAEHYKKKSKDMRHLTELDSKIFVRDVKTGEIIETKPCELSESELCFIYEQDALIQGFGYERDARIEDILKTRDWKVDLLPMWGIGENDLPEIQAWVDKNNPIIFHNPSTTHIEWNKEKYKNALYLAPEQETGSIKGEDLLKKIKAENIPVLNANNLDYLMKHQDEIPEEWKGKRVFFWGTIFRILDGGRGVHCLKVLDGTWYVDVYLLDDDLVASNPAAVLAN